MAAARSHSGSRSPRRNSALLGGLLSGEQDRRRPIVPSGFVGCTARTARIVASFNSSKREWDRSNCPASTGRTMCDEALKLDGLLIKALQQVGSRNDLVRNKELREPLKGLCAFPSNTSRAKQKVFDTLCSDMQLSEVRELKSGTVGDVRLVKTVGNDTELVLKTVNFDARDQYATDFKIFQGFLKVALNGFFGVVEQQYSYGKTVRAVVIKVISLVNDKGFEQQLMDEFKLELEAENQRLGKSQLTLAASFLEHVGCLDALSRFSVPEVHRVWECYDGAGMLMEFIDKKNLTDHLSMVSHSDEELGQIAKELSGVYYHGLHTGFVNADLHPGNILIDFKDGKPYFHFIDWGSVLKIPPQHREAVFEFLDLCRGPLPKEQLVDQFGELFQRLGVTVKVDQQHNFDSVSWAYLAQCLDVVDLACGDNAAEALKRTECLDLPTWVMMWCKTAGAFALTLSSLEVSASDMQRVIQALQEALR